MQDENILSRDITALLNSGNYKEAKGKLISELETLKVEENNYTILLAEIAGFLIDIGSESLDEQAAKMGTEILIKHEELFKETLSQQSFHYCLANGMNALYKIQMHGKGLPSINQITPLLIGSKKHYFKAFKDINLNQINEGDLQVLSNLGNNLTHSGRIIEAIRLYTSVLTANPNFPQALIGYADDLDYWMRICSSPQSISLYLVIYRSYDEGLKWEIFPPAYKTRIENSRTSYKKSLEKLEFDFNTIAKEEEISKEEYVTHSPFRKFCINNFLALNEHVLFCKCSEGGIDDLSIVHNKLSVYGEKVGKMELLLNRLKSEFALARKIIS